MSSRLLLEHEAVPRHQPPMPPRNYIHNQQDRNIILALAHEYRAPSADIIRKAVEDSGNPSAPVSWTSRYVGLVVVPGQHITKIEFEESTLPGVKSGVTL
jgi:hypothetical protein